jgi:hypothetical protein
MGNAGHLGRASTPTMLPIFSSSYDTGDAKQDIKYAGWRCRLREQPLENDDPRHDQKA